MPLQKGVKTIRAPRHYAIRINNASELDLYMDLIEEIGWPFWSKRAQTCNFPKYLVVPDMGFISSGYLIRLYDETTYPKVDPRYTHFFPVWKKLEAMRKSREDHDWPEEDEAEENFNV